MTCTRLIQSGMERDKKYFCSVVDQVDAAKLSKRFNLELYWVEDPVCSTSLKLLNQEDLSVLQRGWQ